MWLKSVEASDLDFSNTGKIEWSTTPHDSCFLGNACFPVIGGNDHCNPGALNQ